MIEQIARAERSQKVQNGIVDREFDGAAGLALIEKRQQEAVRRGELHPKLTIAAQMLPALERDLTPARYKALERIFKGEAHGLEAHMPAWLRELNAKPRQVADYTRAVRKMVLWLVQDGAATTIEAIDRRTVGRYISHRVELGHNSKSINKDISAISSLYRFLVRRGIADSNPLQGQSLPKQKRRTKQAWTTEQLKVIIANAQPDSLKQALLVLAYSGLRANELATARILHVNVRDRTLSVIDGKTGDRLVPLHSKIFKAIILPRCQKKHANDFLFHEWPTPKADSLAERSQWLTKRFTKLRRGLAQSAFNELNPERAALLRSLDHRREGARVATSTLHDLRSWFITQADQAGCRREDVERVCGHKSQGMSFGHYSAGSSLEQLRAVVESVKLG
jgi:site-specific recombinase XerC